MAWRRKPDGRPYADINVSGRRRRVSLLKRGEGTIDDLTAQARYAALVRALGKQDSRQGRQQFSNPERLLGWYCSTVMVARGNRERTIAENRTIFKRFAQFLSSRGVETLTQLSGNPGTFDEFVVWRAGTAKPSTVNKEIAVIRAAFRAAFERHLIDELPTRRWPRLKVEDRGYPEPLSREDFARLLDSLKDTPYYDAVRFVAYTGCRPSDAAGLLRANVHGLDTTEPTAVFAQRKTGRNIAIALSPPAVTAIRDAMRGRLSLYVFTRDTGQPVSPDAISNAVRRRAKALGLTISAKSFRQSLVSALYDLGADDLLIRRITGHRSDAIGAYRQLRRRAAYELADRYAEEMDG